MNRSHIIKNKELVRIWGYQDLGDKEIMKHFYKQQQAVPLMLLVGLAAVLRFIYLGRAELWQDEIIFVDIISDITMSSSQVFRNYWDVVVSMAQLPFAGVLQNIWMHAVHTWIPSIEYSTFWLRFPHAVMGTAAVAVFLRLAFRVLSRKEAWIAGVMMAVSFYPVFYSREAYCYASVLFFAAISTWLYIRVLSEEKHKAWVLLSLFLSQLCLAYSHFAGSLYVAAMVALPGLMAAYYVIWEKKCWTEAFRFIKPAILTSGLAMLLILPYYVRILTADNPHLKETSDVALLLVFNDVISKMFLGDQVWASVLAWLFFLSGVAGFVHAKQKKAHVVVCVLLGLTAGLLLLGTHSTQYISSRYFSPLVPLIYLIFARGIWSVVNFLGRCLKMPVRLRSGLAGTIVVIYAFFHFVLYLPPYYMLRHKSTDYKSIAEWLNSNLKEGTPYLIESGFELRFVPGYHRTPGLIAVDPYLHEGGTNSLRLLRHYHEIFMRKFPEAPYIESNHYGIHYDMGRWEWPDRFYARQERLTNAPIKELIRSGIYPSFYNYQMHPMSFVHIIHYNTEEDLKQMAMEQSHGVKFSYPGWLTVPLKDTPEGGLIFSRGYRGDRSELYVENLSAESNRGTIRLEGMIGAPPQECLVFIQLDGQPIGGCKVASQSDWETETKPFDLPPGLHKLHWGVVKGRGVQLLGLHNIEFFPLQESD